MATLTRIAPELAVDDLSASIAYYTQRLGFELAMEMPGEYAIVERDGIAIHLFHDGSRIATPGALHIFTNQLDDLHAELMERGATICAPPALRPWGNRDFRVTGSTGNILKFTEPLREQ